MLGGVKHFRAKGTYVPTTSILRVRAVRVESTGVLVTFAHTYLKRGVGSAVTGKGERTLSRLALLTNGCEVVHRTPYTIELVGQQGNNKVNSSEALSAALCDSGHSRAQRTLTCSGWSLWAVERASSSRIARVGAVPAGTTLIVDVGLGIDDGFTPHDRQSLAEFVRGLPHGELVESEGDSQVVYVRYASSATGDVALANEVGELVDMLAKLF